MIYIYIRIHRTCSSEVKRTSNRARTRDLRSSYRGVSATETGRDPSSPDGGRTISTGLRWGANDLDRSPMGGERARPVSDGGRTSLTGLRWGANDLDRSPMGGRTISTGLRWGGGERSRPVSVARVAETPRYSVGPEFELGRWSFSPVAGTVPQSLITYQMGVP